MRVVRERRAVAKRVSYGGDLSEDGIIGERGRVAQSISVGQKISSCVVVGERLVSGPGITALGTPAGAVIPHDIVAAVPVDRPHLTEGVSNSEEGAIRSIPVDS